MFMVFGHKSIADAEFVFLLGIYSYAWIPIFYNVKISQILLDSNILDAISSIKLSL